MIDVLLIIIFVVIFLFFQIIKLQEEARTIINLILLSSIMSYIGFNISDTTVSKMFLVLSVVTILLIPVNLIIKYIEKIQN